jgi:YggT family protein
MEIVCAVLQLYLLVVFIRVLMSWFPPTPGTTYASIYEFFDMLTDPVLTPVRRLLPGVPMGTMQLDLSPLVVFLGGGLILKMLGCGGFLF